MKEPEALCKSQYYDKTSCKKIVDGFLNERRLALSHWMPASHPNGPTTLVSGIQLNIAE